MLADLAHGKRLAIQGIRQPHQCPRDTARFDPTLGGRCVLPFGQGLQRQPQQRSPDARRGWAPPG